MMKNEVKLRWYDEGDISGIVELLQIGFGKWPYFDIVGTPVDYWKWKYLDKPSVRRKKSVVLVGDYYGQVVCVNHALLLNINIGSEIFFCSLGGDVVIHPDFRGAGFMHKLRLKSQALRREIGVRLNYLSTTNPIVYESLSKRYNTFPFDIRDLVRITDVDLHLRVRPHDDAWLMKFGYRAASLLGKVTAPRLERPETRAFQISEVSSFDGRIDGFWEGVSEHHNFIIERDRDVLNWKYCDPRAGNHVVLQAEDEDGVLGYVVVRIDRRNPDYPLGHVIDLLALPDRIDVADALMGEAVARLDGEGVNITQCKFVQGHPYKGVALRHGFIDSRKETHILHFPFIGEDDILKQADSSLDKIHFVYADM